MNHEKWMELADLYTVGALDGGDAAEFHTHLESGCELCQYRISENEAALTSLVQELPQLQASAALKNRVMDAVETDLKPVLVMRPAMSPVWAALAWILLSGFVVWGWKATSLKRHALEFKRMESVMMARGQAKMVEMKPMDSTEHAFGKMIWSSKGDCLFMTMGLPRPERSKTYQLWGLVGDQKVSAGVFQVDEHGCGVLAMKNFDVKSFQKMAVTLEPAGGVSSPTGPLVLLGNL